MKHGLLFLALFFVQNAFALYGAKVEVASEGYVVSLHNNGRYFCSGVLISPTTVLTAGHCINGQGLEEFDSSHGLVYEPELLIVKAGNQSIKARSVTYAPTYFEGLGFETEDLALIVLSSPVKDIKPIALASKNDLVNKAKITLIARNKKVEANIIFARVFGTAIVSFIDKVSGACLGDSGGAVVINKNGQQKLAGILMYNGEGTCDRKSGYAYFPKARF